MMYVEAPKFMRSNTPSLFLAGGISGTQDWQREMVGLLEETNWTILNPRRAVYEERPEAGVEQIRWEHFHLQAATARLFWFPPETLCPITLFELGACTRLNGALFVGVHTAYARRFDVFMQVALARPEVTVVSTLEDLAEQAASYLGSLKRGAA